jgi:alanine dehydrogenase
MALLNLFDPHTEMPLAVFDACGITDMRTDAVAALGAKQLAPKKPKVLGHIGAHATAYWNIRLLDHLFDFDEIRVHSRRPESRETFAEKLHDDLRKNIIVTDNWRDCLEGADIQAEASPLSEPTPLFESA